eukprot:251840_1
MQMHFGLFLNHLFLFLSSLAIYHFLGNKLNRLDEVNYPLFGPLRWPLWLCAAILAFPSVSQIAILCGILDDKWNRTSNAEKAKLMFDDIETEQTQCPICRRIFEDNEDSNDDTLILICGHRYCQNCIAHNEEMQASLWNGYGCKCPVCRNEYRQGCLAFKYDSAEGRVIR